ncbi:MAG: acyl carrier protein [Eubacteriaceae bacterium]|nr:acyl carrier protein [Eubacteriaceae bacterium]
MDIRQTIVNILTEVKPTKNLEGIEDIVEGGYIDSFELMGLITAMSETFGIEIEVDEIVPENFNSIDAIVKMVERLK